MKELSNAQMAHLQDLEPEELEEPLVLQILMDCNWQRHDNVWRHTGTSVPAFNMGAAASKLLHHYVMGNPYHPEDE